MDLQEYFKTEKGTGILSTADAAGFVNSAVYATPHTMEEGLLAFNMRERKTYDNILVNPHVCYLFIEAGKLSGKRIYLTKSKEEKNSELLFSLRRRCKHEACETDEDLHLVFFSVDKVLPLVGDGGVE